MLDGIGKSIIIAVFLLAATAAMAMAMDRATMLTMFWGGDSYVSTLEMVDSLEMLDALEMN